MGKSLVTATGFDPEGPFAKLLLPYAFRKRQSETRFKQEWLLTHFQHLCFKLGWGGDGDPKQWMLREFKGPRRQRGIICATAAYIAAPAGNVQIGAHSLTDEKFSSGTTDARIQWQNDGQLWAFRVWGSDFEYPLEWWSDEPETSIGDSYECRHISTGKIGTFSVQAAVANTWITITTGREWGVTRTTNGTKSCTATFEVGDDGAESADDSAVFTTTATLDFL